MPPVHFSNRDNHGQQIGFYLEQKINTVSKTKSFKSIALSSYTKYKNSRTDTTCQWLLNSEQYKQWADKRNSSALWIHGQVGCGKSTLVARAIEDVVAKEKEYDEQLLYFFADKETATLKHVLLTFWDQVQGDNDGSDGITTGDSRDDLINNRSDEQLAEMIITELRKKDTLRVRIVIDAVDELPKVDQTALGRGFIEKCYACKHFSRVSLLASYRTTNDAPTATERKVDRDIHVSEIHVTETETKTDMETYLVRSLGDKLHVESNKGDWKEADIKEVAGKVSTQAKGMFLWAKAVVDIVCSMHDKQEVNRAIERLSLPKDIQEAYERVVTQWESKKARRQLQNWECTLALHATALLAHEGLLSVEALAEAAPLNTGTKKINRKVQEDVLKDPGMVVRLCSPFVEHDGDLGVFRFAHTSMHDYFFSRVASRATIADLTIAYLCREEFRRGPFRNAAWYDPGNEFLQWITTHPFLEFAALHWVDAVRASKTDNGQNRKSTRNLLSALYRADENLLLAFQIYRFTISASLPAKLRPAHVFSYFGLFDHLFSSSSRFASVPDASTADADGCTTLHWAILGSNPYTRLTTVRCLMPSDATAAAAAVAAVDNQGQTPLHYAAREGDLPLVRVLLDNDAGKRALDARSPSHGTALRLAAREGHADVVRELLHEGANFRAESELGTALHAAVAGGSLDCVVAICDSSPRPHKDLDVFGDAFGTPLHTAAHYGHKEIVEALLERRFDARKKSWQIGSTVTAAAAGCYEGRDTEPYMEIIKMLLERGADVNSAGHTQYAALHHAAHFGHADVTTLLLEEKSRWRRANVKKKSPMGTPFDIAIEKGHMEVVKVLHTKPRIRDGKGGLVIRRAIRVLKITWVPIFHGALAGRDMTLIEFLIGLYEKAVERAIRNGQQNTVEQHAPLGTTIFEIMVELATREKTKDEKTREEKEKKKKDKKQPLRRRPSTALFKRTSSSSSSNQEPTPTPTPPTKQKKAPRPKPAWREKLDVKFEMALCYFHLKAAMSERGVAATSRIAATGQTVDSSSSPMTFENVLDRLTKAAVLLLGAAFDCKNFKAVRPLANAWTDALLCIESGAMLMRLVDRRGKELRDILTADGKTPEDKFREAGNLASVGIELLATAIERGPPAEMLADGFALLLADALDHAATDDKGKVVRSQDIFHVLNAFLTMFRDALDPPNRARVELLTKAGAEMVVESVKTGNEGLIVNMDRMMQAVRQDAKEENMMDVVEGVLEKKRKDIVTIPAAELEKRGIKGAEREDKDNVHQHQAKDETKDQQQEKPQDKAEGQEQEQTQPEAGSQGQDQSKPQPTAQEQNQQNTEQKDQEVQDQQKNQPKDQQQGQKPEEKMKEKKETKGEKIKRIILQILA
ncbi:Ankyrin repeat protein [Lasiodiplodia theobromae]|uniref:Ankyrin repeat protein n=1 Tax=Lasiodiplodia theobromae TaxID=45133 RepID=UPI0015C3CD7C|nr:Ankyrin repeat protein [Lasiodiplodia theobromae]KAF4543366.1 Ankyrin repeat protein [Lasiodiplodia theobromae]